MSDIPVGLGDRGLSIWKALKSGDVSRDALALEAARTADRLDELDNIIQGKGVLNLMQFRSIFQESDDDTRVIEVKFQNVFSEARQQQTTFATLLDRIDRLGLTARAPKGDEGRHLPAGVTALDKIRARVKQETG